MEKIIGHVIAIRNDTAIMQEILHTLLMNHFANLQPSKYCYEVVKAKDCIITRITIDKLCYREMKQISIMLSELGYNQLAFRLSLNFQQVFQAYAEPPATLFSD
jgi:hypothetical protein